MMDVVSLGISVDEPRTPSVVVVIASDRDSDVPSVEISIGTDSVVVVELGNESPIKITTYICELISFSN